MKEGQPIFREYVRMAFRLGPALRQIGIELHLVCQECRGEVAFETELTVDEQKTVTLPEGPAEDKGLKAVCDCMERGIWGK